MKDAFAKAEALAEAGRVSMRLSTPEELKETYETKSYKVLLYIGGGSLTVKVTMRVYSTDSAATTRLRIIDEVKQRISELSEKNFFVVTCID